VIDVLASIIQAGLPRPVGRICASALRDNPLGWSNCPPHHASSKPGNAPALAWEAHSRFDPYLFVDLGYGSSSFAPKDASLASTGLGINLSVANTFEIDVAAADALVANGNVRQGEWRVHIDLTASY
jgi:hypothetical protein